MVGESKFVNRQLRYLIEKLLARVSADCHESIAMKTFPSNFAASTCHLRLTLVAHCAVDFQVIGKPIRVRCLFDPLIKRFHLLLTFL